jgi:tRNA pseudouridine38-40 synthase
VVWHAAVKLAYDGRKFMGSQRQPGERTVEGETIEALQRIGAIRSPAGSRFRFASRTDRGVSALGNVASFTTSFERTALLRALNAAAPDVLFYAWAEVPEGFSPRRAKGRWYRYLLPSRGLDVEEVRRCAALFEGRHDFRRFCKPDGRSTVKTMTSVDVTDAGELVVVDLRAREFLRSMVRRMVAAMAEAGAGRASLGEVARALEGEDLSFGLAPPQQLTLMDVDHGLDYRVERPPTLRRKVAAYRVDALSRTAFIDALGERLE